MSMAAVGFRVHSGWSAVVVLTLDGGKPAVLARQRLELVEIFDYQFRQPYHTAERMEREKGPEFVAQISQMAREIAYGELRKLQTETRKLKFRITKCGLLVASGRPLPDFEKIMRSHPLLHTAEGELFREALARAAERCGMRVSRVREKEVVAEGVRRLGVAKAALLKILTELGRGLGAPWSQDEKYAALAAWMALCEEKGRAPRRQARTA